MSVTLNPAYRFKNNFQPYGLRNFYFATARPQGIEWDGLLTGRPKLKMVADLPKTNRATIVFDVNTKRCEVSIQNLGLGIEVLPRTAMDKRAREQLVAGLVNFRLSRNGEYPLIDRRQYERLESELRATLR
jgi:hypothetical protein